MLNKLLERQAKKYLGATDDLPDQYKAFLQVISDSYEHYENDRKLLERSSDLSSKEMLHLNGQLRKEADEVKKTHGELNRILNNINEAFFSMDMTTGRYVFISPACEKIYGYTIEEFIADPLLRRRLIHPDDMHLIANSEEILSRGEIVNLEYRIIHKDKSIRWVNVKGIPTLQSGRLICKDAVVNDITTRKNAQLELEKANRDLSMLFNNIDDVVYSVDMVSYQLIHMSPACEAIYGYKPADFYANGDLWNQVMHPDDRYLLEDHNARLNSGLQVKNQYRIIHKDGYIRWIENSVTPTMNNEGHLVRLDGVTRDITGRKHVEIDLRESQLQIQTIFNASLDAIVIIDDKGKIVKWDDKSVALFGWEEDEVLGTLLSEVVIPERFREMHERGMKHFMRSGDGPILGKTLEVRALSKHRGEFDISLSVSPSLVKDKYQFIGFVRDITERKVAEESLRQSERNFRELFESAPEAIVILDLETGLLTDCNANATKMFGYSREELAAKTPGDISPPVQPDGRDSTSAAMEQVGIAMTGAKVCFEWAHCNAEGASFPCEVHLTRLSIPGRSLMRGSVVDISDRKSAEQNLEKAHQELNTLFNTIDEVIYSVDVMSGKITHMSPACEKVYGYKPIDFCGDINLWYMVTHPDDLERVSGHYASLMMGEHIIGQCRIAHKSGTMRWVEYNMVPTLNEEGLLIRIDGVTRDITDKKIAEQNLEKAHQELNNLFNTIEEVIYSIDMANGSVIRISPACEKVYGYKPEDFYADITLWYQMTHPDDMDSVMALTPRLAAGEHILGQCRIINKNKDLRWIEYNLIPTLDASGVPVRVDGVTRDITDKRLAEEKLGKASLELSNLFNSIGEVLYSLDLVNFKFLQMSPACEKIFGYPPAAFYANPGLWRELIHPDDSAFIGNNQPLLEIGKIVHSQYRIRHKDQSWRWIESTVTPTLDQNGALIRIDGVATDINDRKIAEELLKQSEEGYRLICSNPMLGVSWSGPDGILFKTNEAFADMLGYSLDEMIGMHFSKFTHPEDYERDKPLIRQLFLGGISNFRCEKRYITKTGNILWGELNLNSIKDQHGTVQYSIGIIQDISARKQAEEEIRKSEANLRAVFENTDTGYLLLDPTLHIVSFNQRIQQFAQKDLHVKFEEGNCIIDYFLAERGPILRGMMGKALTGQDIYYEIKYPNPGLMPTWYHIRMLAVREGEQIIGLTMSLTDISDQKNNEENIKAINESLEKKVKERTAQLESSNNELEAFSYSVSHDLRAPLRIINGYGQLLIDDCEGKLNEEDKDNLQVIMSTTDQMGHLIDDLLNFSRLGRASVDKKRINMTQMANSVIDEFKTGNISTPVIMLHDLPPADCDPNLTKQVWINLLSNAIKYSAKSKDPRIEVGSKLLNGSITYYVKDNGAGFDMQYADKLFGVFQRLHDGSDYEGTGVGLALTHRIVTRQGGQIWAEAKVNEGATFYFSFPCIISN
ncbi:MAG: multi-sensor signal transduction histidine kinase [Bacteroidetes bacterium]|nr:multi-sensor signal transduction histidine kinase [Bacteroidota bacterium]